MAISLEKAELFSLPIEGVLYGVYAILFACTVYVLIYKRTTPHIHYGMFGITLLMFVLATMHIVVNCIRVFQAFDPSKTQSRTPFDVLKNYGSSESVFRSALIIAQVTFGDMALIYRCYVAWGNNLRIIAFPLLLLLATAVTGGGVIYTLAHSASQINLLDLKQWQIFVISTQVLGVFLYKWDIFIVLINNAVVLNNILCTVMSSWKLWRMSRAMVSRSQRRSLIAVARIIAESGVLTTTTWIIWICLNALRQPAHIIVLNALAPITGTSFCLIVTRVGFSTIHSDIPQSPNETVSVPYRGETEDTWYGEESFPPVLDGTGRPHRPMEISVISRESIRVETQLDMELEAVYKDKVAKSGLAHLSL